MTFTSLPHWFDTLGEVSAWLACVAYAGESVFSGIGGDIDAMDLPVSFRLPWLQHTGVHFMVRSGFHELEEEKLRYPACCR